LSWVVLNGGSKRGGIEDAPPLSAGLQLKCSRRVEREAGGSAATGRVANCAILLPIANVR
jgi:hypothetical protein